MEEEIESNIDYVQIKIKTSDGETVVYKCNGVSVDENYINISHAGGEYEFTSFPVTNVVSLSSKKVYKD